MVCFAFICISEDGVKMNRVALAQLTQLYMTLKLECPFYKVFNYYLCQVRYLSDKDNTDQIPGYTPAHLTSHQYVRFSASQLFVRKPEPAIILNSYISQNYLR